MTTLPDNAGTDFRVEDHIYTFNDPVLVIEDLDTSSSAATKHTYVVAAVSVGLVQNRVPVASVTIASFAVDDIDERTPVFKPTLLDFVGGYQELQRLVLANTTVASLVIVVERSDGNETQRIDIQQWKLTDVSIHGAQQKGAFNLIVTLEHPMFEATSSTGWLPNSAQTLNTPRTFTSDKDLGSNLLGLFFSVNSAYIKKAQESISGVTLDTKGAGEPITSTIECVTDIQTLSDVVFERLKKALETFKANISWEPLGGSDLPLEAAFTKAALDKYTYFGRLLWQLAGRQESLWSIFISLLNEFDLLVSGAPNSSKLLVTPFVPWGKYSMTLFDSECTQVDFAGTGNRDVSGVLIAYDQGAQNDATLGYGFGTESSNTVSNPAQLNTAGGYVCPLMKEPLLLGPLVYRDAPAWLREYLYDQSGNFGLNSESNPMGRKEANYQAAQSYLPASSNGRSTGRTKVKADVSYAKMVNTWSQQAFFRLYKSDNTCGLETRLLIQSSSANTPDNFVRPGIVVKVSSIILEGDSVPSSAQVVQTPSGQLETVLQDGAREVPVCYFYVTGVYHSITPANSTAKTVLTGTYLRFDGDMDQAGISAEDVENGIENPLYGSLGQFEADEKS